MDIPLKNPVGRRLTPEHDLDDEVEFKNPKTISTPIVSQQELQFEEFIGSPVNSRKSQEQSSEEEQENDSGIETLLPSQSKVNLDDFQLLKVVGKGGYGKVFQVVKKDTQNIYAMKVLKKDFLIKSKNVEYTKAERDILQKVQHPFIVSLHYCFQNQQKIYLVMDFVNGGQLLFHLREQAMFSEKQVQFYAAEVVLALEYLHKLDVIHRDLKPENILLNSEGHIVITDFGFAKELMVDQKTRTWCGTIAYMAPETIKGTGYGKLADWWSVGILIFDMLTGEPPFRHKNEDILQKKILNDKIRLPNYLSSESHSIIKGLLNRDEKKDLGVDQRVFKRSKAIHFLKVFTGRNCLTMTLLLPSDQKCQKDYWTSRILIQILSINLL